MTTGQHAMNLPPPSLPLSLSVSLSMSGKPAKPKSVTKKGGSSAGEGEAGKGGSSEGGRGGGWLFRVPVTGENISAILL